MSEVDDVLLNELDETEEAPLDESSAAKSDNEIEEAYASVSFRIVYQQNNFFLPQIQDLINGKEVINLRPEYQRRLRWPNKKKSLLVESLLLNIPVPPIFLYESDLARYEVMDGQQRLNAIHDYLENDFSLTGLEKLSFLNGRRYKKLPPRVRRGLDRASLGAIVLLQESKSDPLDPYLVRRYVFERLNTGGEKLNPQELRNSLYRGAFNDMIVRLARNSVFCKIFGIPAYTETDENEYYENPQRQKNTLYRKMSDCQIVLRYLALIEDENIRGSMRSMLDGCMKSNRAATQDDIRNYETDFAQLIQACDTIFLSTPFLLPPDENGKQRLSVALFDAYMVALHRRKHLVPKFLEKAAQIRAATAEVLETQLALLTGKANTAQSVKDRIAAVGAILDAVAT
ncbi:MAG: DUF262 domain-containing protein [Terricaulis sp.]